MIVLADAHADTKVFGCQRVRFVHRNFADALDAAHSAGIIHRDIKPANIGKLLLGLGCRAKQLEAKRQRSGTPAIGQEAEVADAHEAFGEQVQHEAAQELIERKIGVAPPVSLTAPPPPHTINRLI